MLDDEGIRYYIGANAGFFLWLDFREFVPPASSADKDPWVRETALLVENRVFITDGQNTFAEEPGFYQFIFSLEERVVKEGLWRYETLLIRTGW